MHACVFACTMRVFLLSSACVSPYILELKIQILTTLKRFHLRRAGHCPRKLRQCAQLFLQAFFTAAQESIVAKVFRGPAFCCAHAAFRLVQAVGILFLTFFVFFVPGKTPAAGLVCEENKEERRQKMKRVGLRIQGGMGARDRRYMHDVLRKIETLNPDLNCIVHALQPQVTKTRCERFYRVFIWSRRHILSAV